MSNDQKTRVRQPNLRATRASLLPFWNNPCAISFHGGGDGGGAGWLFAKPSLMQAFTTPKTPPRCFGLASEEPPRRPLLHHAYKSCIAVVFVYFIHDFVSRQTNTRTAEIMKKPKGKLKIFLHSVATTSLAFTAKTFINLASFFL